MSSRPPEPPPRRGSTSDLHLLPYYHPQLKTMEEVKQALMPYTREEGRFLLRNSISKQGYFTITCVHSTGIKHFNVERTQSTYYLKDVQFETLDQLVNYYSHTDVPNKELIYGVRLKYPITRATSSHLPRTIDVDPRHCPSPDVYLHPDDEERIKKEKSMNPPSQPAPPPPRVITVSGGYIRRNPSMPTQSERPLAGQSRRSSLSSAGNQYPQHNATGRVDEGGYTQIVDMDTPQADKMIKQEREMEVKGPRCDCGLPVEKSNLPRGWSIHLSQDEETFGEVYFMSPTRDTSWSLPLNVCLELDAEQQDFIRDRIFEFEHRSKRTARATLMQKSSGETPQPARTTSDVTGSGYIKPSQPSPRNARPASIFPPSSPVCRDSAVRPTSQTETEYMVMNGGGKR